MPRRPKNSFFGFNSDDKKKDTKILDEDEFVNSLNMDKTKLTSEEQDEVKVLLSKYKDIFTMDEYDIGHTDTMQHHIYLSDEISVKLRYQRIPPNMHDEVRSQHCHHLHLKT